MWRCGWLHLCFAVLLLLQRAGSVRAQESPLVPPWGRDLEGANPPTPAESSEPAGPLEGQAKRSWRFTAEYLLAWTKNDRIPVLLTTGPVADERPGALGQQFTRILYGDAIDFEERHGGRFTLEVPAAGEWSLAAHYFLLDSRDVGLRRVSPGGPVLARPFFDVVNGREDSALVTYPGVASGAISIRSDSWLQGAEANLQRTVIAGEHGSIVLLAGVRYLDLDEDLTISENTLVASTGRSINIQDRFGADNDFVGGQVGARAEWTRHRFTLGLSTKVALGAVRETILIRGRTIIDTTPATDVPGGLLALASNSGRASRNAFAVVPELGAKLGVRVSERLTLFGGYNFIYWSNVARPGQQIDRNLNPNLIPTSVTFGGPADPRQPTRAFRTDDYWMQCMMFGVELRY